MVSRCKYGGDVVYTTTTGLEKSWRRPINDHTLVTSLVTTACLAQLSQLIFYFLTGSWTEHDASMTSALNTLTLLEVGVSANADAQA